MRAIVVSAPGAEPSIVEVPSRPLAAGDVRIRVEAYARCPLDLTLTGPGPVVLGHEVAGTVVETAPDVTRLVVGERVLVTRADPCRSCASCRRGQPALCLDPPHRRPAAVALDVGPGAAFGVGGFADEVVVSETRALPLIDGLSLVHAATLGCTVLTGASAVRNAARLVPGERVAVVGITPTGLAAVAAATLVGARAVIAVGSAGAEAADDERAIARALGATAVLHPRATDVISALVDATDGVGADAVIAVDQSPTEIEALWQAVRPGGLLVVVAARGGAVRLDLTDAASGGRTLVAAPLGLSDHDRDLSWLVPLATQGALGLDHVVDTRPGGLEAVLESLRASDGPTHRQLVTTTA